MDNSELAQLRNSLKLKSKDELLSIWVENNRQLWPNEAFKVIKEELASRGVTIPKKKSAEESMASVDFRKDAGSPFFSISLKKLVIMSIFTLGIYEIYWFYRNWKFLKEKHGFKVIPLARAIFSPIFCYSLFNTVKSYATQHEIEVKYKPSTLTVCYVLLVLTNRAPSPLDILSFLTFIPLLSVQKTINDLNNKLAPGSEINEKFTGLNILGIALGAIFWILVILGLFLSE